VTVQVLIVVVSLVAAAALTLPLWRPRKAVRDRSEHDLVVYRQQLADVDGDIARGAMTESEGQAVRLEVERRMLKAARTVEATKSVASPRRALAAVILIAVPAASIGLYQLQGSPGLPGVPFAERAPDETPDRARIVQLLERIEKRLEADPSDPRGWRLLGQGYLSLGEPDKAANALSRGVKNFPDDPDMKAAFGEALVLDSNGIVGPEALRIFQEVLAADPAQVAPRYYIALSQLQAGQAQEAYDSWRTLATDSPADAPYLKTVQKGLDEAAKQLGTKPEDATKLAKAVTSAPPQPSQEAVDAAQSMTPEQRDQFVRSMVERLAARLEESPDDLEGWLRLGQAYAVLGEGEKAADAYRKAKGLMKPDDSRRPEIDRRIATLENFGGAENPDSPSR
jgi:cytochrome c-type biogenesis protein CcmH